MENEPLFSQYEFHAADNGAILIDCDNCSTEVAEHSNGVEGVIKMLGENIYADIEHYMDENMSSNVRITIKIEPIKPLYKNGTE